MVVGGLHLRIDQAGLSGRQPQVVMGTPPVAQVVINTTAATAPLLFTVAQAGHIAVVVVAPHQCHVVGNAQAALHDLQNFLVGDKHLGNLRHVLVDILFQKLALVVYHLLQSIQFLFAGLHTLHRAVVDTTHADGEECFCACHFLQAFGPVIADGLAVGDIVVGATLFHIPLRHIVAKQGLAMRRADQYATGVSYGMVSFHREKAGGALMHRRPDHVGTKTQQKFEDLFVCSGADGAFHAGRLKRLRGPFPQAPVLVVDKDAAVGHTRALKCSKAVVKRQRGFSLWNHVAPPNPGRDTGHARQFKQTIGTTATVIACHHDLSFMHADPESIHLLPHICHRAAHACQPAGQIGILVQLIHLNNSVFA